MKEKLTFSIQKEEIFYQDDFTNNTTIPFLPLKNYYNFFQFVAFAYLTENLATLLNLISVEFQLLFTVCK